MYIVSVIGRSILVKYFLVDKKDSLLESVLFFI